MADIFVSYARSDRQRVAPLVAALEAQGFSVWWDPEIVGGQEFDALITRELEAAKAAIVVWTPTSVGSRWVRGEARFAADRGVLTPIQFEAPSLPLDFRAIHTIDFDDWDGDAQGGPFQDLTRALGLLFRPSSMPPAPATATAARAVSICVLPFANMSRDEDQEYFADGISEDIITDLSKVSALSVIARHSAFAFKGKSLDVRQVARQLDVSHVLEGSVRKAGDRVRITAQLIDGAKGDHLWAERWDRDLGDIFALQDEISQAIVGALKLRLFPEEKTAIGTRGTANVEAYDKYLRARALANLADSASDLVRAQELYRQALEIDPEFAAPRAGIAMAYVWLGGHYALGDLPQGRTELEALAEEALAQAPDHWGSQFAHGINLASRNQWLGAIAAMERAHAQAPISETALANEFAMALAAVGRIKDAIRILEPARAADPLSIDVSRGLQETYLIDERLEDARSEYERTTDLPGYRNVREHVAMLRAWAAGDREAVRARYRAFVDSMGWPFVEGAPPPFLDKGLDVLDEPEAALAILREASEDPTIRNFLVPVIGLHAGLYGDDALAVAGLRRGILEFNWGGKLAIWVPGLAATRRTAAFRQLVRDMGVYDYWRASGNWGDFARPVGDDDFEIIR
jgi:adenylate cyclase